jgi:predicted membrane channel-forming protein YqfA (hemolysin III family)
MGTNLSNRYRDGTVVVLVHLLGISYFMFFLISFLLHHFPTSPDTIYRAQVVTFYCVGVLLWSLCSLIYRTLWIFFGDNAAYWQKLEMAGTLGLIYATAIPYMAFAYDQQRYFRHGYLFCLAILTVGRITATFAQRSDESDNANHFRRDCAWLGLLVLAPAIQALCQSRGDPPSLAIGLIRFAGWNVLGALCYLARVPERVGMVGKLRPSLYMVHLLLVLNNISYGRDIWNFIV